MSSTTVKSVITFAACDNVTKHVYFIHAAWAKKQKCLPLASFFQASLIFESKARSLPLEWSNVKGSAALGSGLTRKILHRPKNVAGTNALAYFVTT